MKSSEIAACAPTERAATACPSSWMIVKIVMPGREPEPESARVHHGDERHEHHEARVDPYVEPEEAEHTGIVQTVWPWVTPR